MIKIPLFLAVVVLVVVLVVVFVVTDVTAKKEGPCVSTGTGISQDSHRVDGSPSTIFRFLPETVKTPL